MTTIEDLTRNRYKSLRRVITNPAINDSVTFITTARDGYTTIRSWKTFLMATVALKMGDMRFCGVHAIMNPFVSLAATIARNKGIEKELISKYCI